MKSEKELNALKEDVKALNGKLHSLADDELQQVTGGDWNYIEHEVELDAAGTPIYFPDKPDMGAPVNIPPECILK